MKSFIITLSLLIILCASARVFAVNMPCFYSKPLGLSSQGVAQLRKTSQTYGPEFTQKFLGKIRGKNPRAFRRLLTEAESPQDLQNFSRFLDDLPSKSLLSIKRMLKISFFVLLLSRPSFEDSTLPITDCAALIGADWCDHLGEDLCGNFLLDLGDRLHEFSARGTPSRLERFGTQRNRILGYLAHHHPRDMSPSDRLTLFQWMDDLPSFQSATYELGLTSNRDLFRKAKIAFGEARNPQELQRELGNLSKGIVDTPEHHMLQEYYAQKVLDFVASNQPQKRVLWGKIQNNTGPQLYRENFKEVLDFYDELLPFLGGRRQAVQSEVWLSFQKRLKEIQEEVVSQYRQTRKGVVSHSEVGGLRSLMEDPHRIQLAKFLSESEENWRIGGGLWSRQDVFQAFSEVKNADDDLFRKMADAFSDRFKAPISPTDPPRASIARGYIYNTFVARDLVTKFPGKKVMAEPEVLGGYADFLVRNFYEEGRDVLVEAKTYLGFDVRSTHASQRASAERLRRQLERAAKKMMTQEAYQRPVDFELRHPGKPFDVAPWLQDKIQELNKMVEKEETRRGLKPRSLGRFLPPQVSR
ncbi:MAG: hypothetical protein HYW47_01030 [Deltaproteobacteria bacterium]|nr:hypothetical protein [Deltaproteobacteria bacterium]